MFVFELAEIQQMAGKNIEYLWHINNDEMAQFWTKGCAQKYLSSPTPGMPRQYIGKANGIYAPKPLPFDVLAKMAGIINAGKTVQCQGYYHSRGRKKYAVLMFLQSGKISVKSESGAKLSAGAGEVLVVPPSRRCDESVKSGKVSLFWLHIGGSPMFDFGSEVKILRPRYFADISSLLEMYLAEVYRDGRSLAMLENIAAILSELLRREFGAPAPRLGAESLAALAEKIRKNPSKNWRRSDAARGLNCPPNALDNLCMKTCGLTFAKMVRSARLKLAREMLESGEEDYSKIARAAGYGSVSALSKAFKAERGISPRAFQRGGRQA